MVGLVEDDSKTKVSGEASNHVVRWKYWAAPSEDVVLSATFGGIDPIIGMVYAIR